MSQPRQRRDGIRHRQAGAHDRDARLRRDSVQHARSPGVSDERRMGRERRRQRRQRGRRMADGQHQQIGRQPMTAIGDNLAIFKP